MNTALPPLPPQPFQFRGALLDLLDQRALPSRQIWISCRNAATVRQAIKKMVVRGAPVIGTVAAYGLYLETKRLDATAGLTWNRLLRAADFLKSARPTAVNLTWAVDRALATVEGKPIAAWVEILAAEADRQAQENIRWTLSIARRGASLIPTEGTVLTICNTGPLATGGYGTALGAVLYAHWEQKKPRVFACETRPYLQGARLTTWELQQQNVPVTLITDNAAAWTMEQKQISLVLVGADRIACNGDTANKVGTLGLAILSRHYGIPFYVAAPLSSFDSGCETGATIQVEERDPREVLSYGRKRIAPEGISVFNPSFDVTPAALIAGYVTEQGLVAPPFHS
jgi:methylthioribose-1-phosphate isomerase